MADRLREICVWLFVAGLVAGLWLYADARRLIANTGKTLSPPTMPAAWHAAHPEPLPGAPADEPLTATDADDTVP
jgi:hypothetical protein